MKKILLTGFIFVFFISLSFSQDGDHVGGGRFSKNIEYNMLWLEIGYNFNSKGDVEKLFFGDFNAPVEFFYKPSFDGASGFRIVRDTGKNSCFLEIKYIYNFHKAQDEAAEKYPPTIVVPIEQLGMPISTKESLELKERQKKYLEEKNNLFKIESRTFPISDKFANKLYEKMFSIINNFKARGVPPMIFDGYSVTFRNVVGDEVWSLRIHEPTGIAQKFADFCRKIIDETIITGKPDEAEYIKLLDEF